MQSAHIGLKRKGRNHFFGYRKLPLNESSLKVPLFFKISHLLGVFSSCWALDGDKKNALVQTAALVAIPAVGIPAQYSQLSPPLS